MARFDFQNPGAAFAEELATVLAERKAEERQKMLDSLSVAADQRAQQQMQQDELWRKEQLARQARQDELAELGIIAGNMGYGDDPYAAGIPEQKIQRGQELGIFREQAASPVPSVSTDIIGMEAGGEQLGDLPQEPSAPQAQTTPQRPRLGYVGSPQEREQQRIAKQQAGIITEMLASDDPKQREKGQLLAQFANMNGGQIPAQAWDVMMPEAPLVIIDEATGKTTRSGTVPRDAKVVMRGHPPQQPVGATRPDFIGWSENGYPMFMDPGSKSVREDRTVRGKDPTEGSMGIPGQTADRHLISIRLMGQDAEEPGNIAQFKQTAKEMIAAARVSGNVKSILMRFADNPTEGTRLMGQMMPTLSPEEKQQLDILMSNTALGFYRNSLMRIVPQAPPGPPPNGGERDLTDVMLDRVK